MVVLSYIIKQSFFCVLFSTLKVYIVCVRKLFVWVVGKRGAQKKKKKKKCLSGIEKNEFGYTRELNQLKKNPK
jgi:hypothetical protein